VSIPSNITEGYCRRKTRVYAHHVSISLGSHGEVETCIELAHRLGFMPPKTRGTLDDGLELVGKLLSGLHRSLEEKLAREEADARGKGAASP
jgi:four helix bundle protein